jgi:hypothetical protein
MLKLKNLEASHPRVAGIVQAHRQQIDAAGIGRQQMRFKDIDINKLPENSIRDKSPDACPLSAFLTARGAPPRLALARRLRASLGPRAL